MDFNAYVKGCCIIRIEGKQIEAFLNEATALAIPLWELRAEGEGVWLGRTEVRTLEILRGIAHKTGVYFQVVENRGLFQFVRRAKKRWYPLVITVLALVFLILYSQSILGVRVASDTKLSDEEKEAILAIAAEYGVDPTLFCDESRWEEGANAILSAHENLAWVGFQKDGVIVTVKIIGKKTPAAKNGTPGNIIAKKDAVIRKIFVLKGEKAVEPDTAVKEGDLLIGAAVIYKNSDGEPSGEEALVHADGIVEGSVWYTAEVTEACTVVKKKKTGNYANAFYCLAGQKELLLWGTEENPFVDSVTKTKQYNLLGMPLFYAKNVSEVTAAVTKRTLGEIESIAYGKAEKEAKKNIPKAAKIVDVKREILAKTRDSIQVRVTVETYENLGSFQSLAEDFEKSIE